MAAASTHRWAKNMPKPRARQNKAAASTSSAPAANRVFLYPTRAVTNPQGISSSRLRIKHTLSIRVI